MTMQLGADAFLTDLVNNAPYAAAGLVVVWLFLRRMEKSQAMGHDIAKTLAADSKDALRVITINHEKVMNSVSSRFEKAIDRQSKALEDLTADVRELCQRVDRATKAT